MLSQTEPGLRDGHLKAGYLKVGHSIELMPGRKPLGVAVPQLSTYHPQTGIGRVFHNLVAHWGRRVALHDAPLKTYKLPLLRNLPFGVAVPTAAELVLLPKLTGAEALRGVCNAPSVVIVHDVGVVDFPGDRASADWFSQQTVMRSFRALSYASHVVAVSAFTRDRLLHYLPELEGRVSVIPNGVGDTFLEYSSTREAAQQRLTAVAGPLGNGPFLLYVGSEIPRKNIPLLLTVLKGVKARHPGAQLLKVGGAGGRHWRAKTLREAERLALTAKDVLFLKLDDDTLADAYRTAHVFVSTSSYEGFGLPILEAMAVGTPVVVSPCASFQEVVGDVGWVAKTDTQPFVETVLHVLAQPQARVRALEGRSQAALYRWRDAATSYLDLMEKLR